LRALAISAPVQVFGISGFGGLVFLDFAAG